MKVLLIGAEINNVNLGCQALTYSLISILEREFPEKNLFYTVMEGNPSKEKTQKMCHDLKIDADRINSIQRGNITEVLRGIRHFKNNILCFKAICESDCIINITQGDGFSDIYGEKRYNVFWGFLMYAIKKKKNIIMAPQTYGPFYNESIVKKAKYVLENCKTVFARDEQSSACIKGIVEKEVIVTTDLAFQLPYTKVVNQSDKVKIGINISSLMAEEKKDNFNQHIDLAKKYNELMCRLVEALDPTQYEVHLIPHVLDDMISINRYGNKYKNLIVHEFFDSPIEAKSLISSMDVFIGSRMHATIASLSSGVVTIPVAYSRKFEGVFNLIECNNTINLYDETVTEAYERINEIILHFQMKEQSLDCSNQTIEKYNRILNSTLRKSLSEIDVFTRKRK